MSEEILKSIDKRLSIITKLLAINAVKGKSAIEQMEFLNDMGMNSHEIGMAIGKTAENVRKQLSLKRKKKNTIEKVKKNG